MLIGPVQRPLPSLTDNHLSNDLRICTQNIIHRPFDSCAVGVRVSGRTHILPAEGKIEEDIWLIGHQWVWLDPLHPSTGRASLPTSFVSYPDASSSISVLPHE